MTDSQMYKSVMNHIIDLRTMGWANEHWRMYEHYALDENEFERMRLYFKNTPIKQLIEDAKNEPQHIKSELKKTSLKY